MQITTTFLRYFQPHLFLCLWVCFIGSSSAAENIIPIENFTKQSLFKSIRLSPDGKHFAAIVPKQDSSQLVVISRDKMEAKIAFSFGYKEHIGIFYWANNQRLVYSKTYQNDNKERKTNRGEIFASNIDGTERKQLFGYSGDSKAIKSKRALSASGKIVHMLDNDDQHILIISKKFGSDFDDPIKLFKVNIYTGKRSLVAKTPFGNMKLIVTADGTPFIASGKDREGKKHLFRFEDDQWQKLSKKTKLAGYSLLNVNEQQDTLYLTKSDKKKTKGLYQYDLNTQKITLLYRHPTVDISSIIKAPDTGTIVGVETMLDSINYHYILPQHPYAILHQQLSATFPKSKITLYANSSKDNEIVFKVINDVTPGEYYIFNQKKQTVKYLISAKPWLKPEDMLPKKAITFKARDKQTIYGYLTFPKNNNKKYPLVVDVHGGPFGVQSSWLFNTTAQLLANRGFAVLQINFRGSGGYGSHYQKTAYLKRSSLIQHDIIDGTRWALSLDNIIDDKVCIIGGSFGGYSALMAPLLEPDLYDCAIPRYGPYDLVYQMTHADYMSKDSVSKGAMKKYGDNEKLWREQSPLTYIDKLKTPLMIVTGGKDTRVPPQSAFNLRKMLDKRDIKYQWLYKKKEAHGFTNPKNKEELYRKTIDFLSLYLKD